MNSEIDPQLARHIIDRIGEAGQPPERGALVVNVGTEGYLDALRQEYIIPIRDHGRNSTFKLVQATFGGGKTQFLHCLREICWEEGFVCALVGVSPKECPFDDVSRIYRSVASSLQSKPDRYDEEADSGIDAILRLEVQRRLDAEGESAVRAWLREEVARATVDSHAVRRACYLFMDAVVTDDMDQEEAMGSFLRGDDVPKRELQDYKVREQLSDKTAYKFLRSLIQVFRAIDIPGVALLFDELDRIMSLTVKRKKAIGDNLRQMIDQCGQQALPGLVWVYAVPPEFMTNVVPEYPALEQRLKGAQRFAPTCPIAPLIDLESLPLGPTDLLEGIGLRLLEIHAVARSAKHDGDLQAQNIHDLAVEFGERQLEVGTRRSFVKAAVHLLETQARESQHRLSQREVEQLASQGITSTQPDLDDEEIF